MTRKISRAESWEKVHEIFSHVNFNSFDYNTIKESLLDHVKIYYPEDYNNYIESSEFIAILDLFAYVGELLSYRLDLNANENFMTTAQRKESVLRLAKMLSYNASRNIPARGLVKLTSVKTTEKLIDSLGKDISGRTIYWNDSNNRQWKDQFITVMNAVMDQPFGTVDLNDRIQIDDVLFELHTMKNNQLSKDGKGVIQYSASSNSKTLNMELVPIAIKNNNIVERRPELNSKMSLVYANDGLGDNSDTTGFLMFTKQGTLSYTTLSFDGITPNETRDILVSNINQTDVWINNVDQNTGVVLTDDPNGEFFKHIPKNGEKYGNWFEVDTINSQNISFNSASTSRRKYEIETLDKDQIRIVFGDGEFSDIPKGVFHVWYRTSENSNYYIEKSSIVDKTISLTYSDSTGTGQTLTLTFSLINSLNNASESESIEHIRKNASSVYYTQDRMVNGKDYNTYMLKDQSILKIKAVNRTFSGDSKYMGWHDPKESYENVKIFGDDLAIYWVETTPETGGLILEQSTTLPINVVSNIIEPLLSSMDFYLVLTSKFIEYGIPLNSMRLRFTSTEYSNIVDSITNNVTTDLYYSPIYDVWTIGQNICDSQQISQTCTLGDSKSIKMITIQTSTNVTGWTIRWKTKKLVCQSDSTKFWNNNSSTRVLNFDGVGSLSDKIVILKANVDSSGYSILPENKEFSIVSHETVDNNLYESGLPDVHRLSIVPSDNNGDGVPDNLQLTGLIDSEFTYIAQTQYPIIDTLSLFNKTFNNNADGLDNDVDVYVGNTRYTFSAGDITSVPISQTPLISGGISFVTPVQIGQTIKIKFKGFCYFNRLDQMSPWTPIEDSNNNRILYMMDNASSSSRLTMRLPGRYKFNFSWFHFTPDFNLIDPAPSNIIDMYILNSGYYKLMTNWLNNVISIKPSEPTPLELRTAYSKLLDNRMISDTVILHSCKLKPIFGSRAIPKLQCKFKVIVSKQSNLTENQIKVKIVESIRAFFDISDWGFGDTFYFTELAASVHTELASDIESFVLVPSYSDHSFGDLFQIQCREDEILIPDINAVDIQIIQAITSNNIRKN